MGEVKGWVIDRAPAWPGSFACARAAPAWRSLACARCRHQPSARARLAAAANSAPPRAGQPRHNLLPESTGRRLTLLQQPPPDDGGGCQHSAAHDKHTQCSNLGAARKEGGLPFGGRGGRSIPLRQTNMRDTPARRRRAARPARRSLCGGRVRDLGLRAALGAVGHLVDRDALGLRLGRRRHLRARVWRRGAWRVGCVSAGPASARGQGAARRGRRPPTPPPCARARAAPWAPSARARRGGATQQWRPPSRCRAA